VKIPQAEPAPPVAGWYLVDVAALEAVADRAHSMTNRGARCSWAVGQTSEQLAGYLSAAPGYPQCPIRDGGEAAIIAEAGHPGRIFRGDLITGRPQD
jgi:hypothetical protein